MHALQYIRQLPSEPSLEGLKAMILIQLYALAEEEYDILWTCKSLAVGWGYQLGLHRKSRETNLNSVVVEMRRRVFWCLYVLDVFSSAVTELPKFLDDRQIHVEFPVSE